MPKRRIDPATLFPSRRYGFSQVVASRGGTTVYCSGQVAWDENEKLVGAGDLAAQARRALENVERAVAAAGGTRDDVISLRIYLVGENVRAPGVGAELVAFFHPDRLPTATWIGVTGLSAGPDVLVEIEAVALIED
jgi:enamine deaminase RidA (YjgF/YER057c/UK114 family)